MNPIIEVKNLSAFYENKAVFENLSFEVQDGDCLCIIGENGSGKTTLMRCLLGLPVKHTGKINYNGISGKDIGYLPQRTVTGNDFPASVEEIIMSGFSGKSVLGLPYKRSFRKTALENMEILEITDLKDRSYSELSGGQQQKVLLCRAMCAKDKLILLDEPVTGLDSESQAELYRLIKKLNDSGVTVIMISHDIKECEQIAKHILNISGEHTDFYSPSEREEEDKQ